MAPSDSRSVNRYGHGPLVFKFPIYVTVPFAWLPGKVASSPDRTSFGTPEALRSPPMAYQEPRRLLSSMPFQSSSGECRVNGFREQVDAA